MSAASVSRWRNLEIQEGNVRPGPLGGDRNSRKTEVRADLITAWLSENRDGTLFELRAALAAKDTCVSKSALHRLLPQQRQRWFDEHLDPTRLVFIDETWGRDQYARAHGRCTKGEQLRMAIPHGHRKTSTLVAGLRNTGTVAPLVVNGPINGA